METVKKYTALFMVLINIFVFSKMTAYGAVYTHIRYRLDSRWFFNSYDRLCVTCNAENGDLFMIFFIYEQPEPDSHYNLVLYRIDRNDGRKLWKYYFPWQDESSYGIIYNYGKLLCITESGIFNINPETGKLIKHLEISCNHPVLYDENYIYLLFDKYAQIVERTTLRVINNIEFASKISSNAIFEGSMLYCIVNGQIIKHDQSKKENIIIYNLDQNYKPNEYIQLYKNNDTIIFTIADKFIYAINTKGILLWKIDLNGKSNYLIDQFKISGNLCLVEWRNVTDSTIYCYNITNGTVKWSYDGIAKKIVTFFLTSNQLAIYYAKECAILDEVSGNLLSRTNLFAEISELQKVDNVLLVRIKNENKSFYKFYPAYSTIKYRINSKTLIGDTDKIEMEQSVQNINGMTYIPAKYLVEPLGGQLTWNQKTKQIKANLLVPGSETLYDTTPDKYEFKENILELTVNSNKATLNGKQLQIDPKNPKITPIIISGRTMVPLRFLAESLGCKVEWKQDTKEIIVTYQP